MIENKKFHIFFYHRHFHFFFVFILYFCSTLDVSLENSFVSFYLIYRYQVLDIVRAAESLALGTHLPSDGSDGGGAYIGHPPKSPVEHEDKIHKTTTIVMSAHTLDTQPQVCLDI